MGYKFLLFFANCLFPLNIISFKDNSFTQFTSEWKRTIQLQTLLPKVIKATKGTNNSGWTEDKIICSFNGPKEEVDMATGQGGDIYVSFAYYYQPLNIWVPVGYVSKDKGKTWQLILYHVIDTLHHHRYPTISIDPYTGYRYVVIEYEKTINDHDIILFRQTHPDSPWYYIEGDVDDDDDRYPSSECEYFCAQVNWLHITYEYIHNYDDRDLMWMYWEIQNNQWQKKKLHGGWLQPYSDWVFHKPNITVGHITDDGYNGYIYITYTMAKDFDSTHKVAIDVLKWDGSSWNLSQTIYSDTVLTNNCRNPKIQATRDGSLVICAYQYDFYGDGSDYDLHYAYSQDTGKTFVWRKVLSALGGNEGAVAITRDGEGTMSNHIGGYLHFVYNTPMGIYFRRIFFATPEIVEQWGASRIDNCNIIPRATIAITTHQRLGKWYPCISWIDTTQSNPYVYFTTKGAVCSLKTVPESLQIRIDGYPYTSPIVRTWVHGDSHQIYAPSPQYDSQNNQYVFSHWSDGGAQQHWIKIINDTTIIAYFQLGIKEVTNKIEKLKIEKLNRTILIKYVSSCDEKDIYVKIYNLVGSLLTTINIKPNKTTIWYAPSSGIYFIKFKNFVYKIIII